MKGEAEIKDVSPNPELSDGSHSKSCALGMAFLKSQPHRTEPTEAVIEGMRSTNACMCCIPYQKILDVQNGRRSMRPKANT